MSRQAVIFLFILVVLSACDQSNGLASILKNVRRTGIDGILRELRDDVQQGISSVPNMPPQQAQPSIARDMGGFDADAYRKEMTELVYRRSLERGFSS
jgi:hypothetical protein